MSTNSVLVLPGRLSLRIASLGIAFAMKAMYVLLASPEYIFLAALTAMLFRPPDLPVLPIDRIAFVALVAVGSLYLLFRRERLHVYTATWPMLALLLLGLWGVLDQPYDAKAWSVFAAKSIVPVAMFHLAGSVFATENSQRKLEWFSLAVLFYLSLTAVFFLLNLKPLIFPRFILDEGIGIHAERARGPFLQAVANGVCLNILGIVALRSFDRRRMRGALAAALFVVTPLALLATKTRAVWLAAGLSAGAIVLFARGRRSRGVALGLAVIAGGVFCTTQMLQTGTGELRDRLQDRSPVEFRLEMYQAGWQIFTEKPLFGWGSEAKVQPEIAKRISSFRSEYYVFHNTYLELAVQRGLLGLGLYAWLFIALFRLGTQPAADREPTRFSGRDFGLTWRVILCVYLLNASAVVMNYQFLNGYLFTIGGILAAQQRLPSGRHLTTYGACNENCISM
jgi:O-antigen ligase